MKKKIVVGIVLVVFRLSTAFLIIQLKENDQAGDIWTHAEFIQAVQSGEVDAAKIIVERNSYRIEGIAKNGVQFHIKTPKDPNLTQIMFDAGVEFETAPAPNPPWWATLARLAVLAPFFISLVQLIVLVLILVYLKKIHDALKNEDI